MASTIKDSEKKITQNDNEWKVKVKEKEKQFETVLNKTTAKLSTEINVFK